MMINKYARKHFHLLKAPEYPTDLNQKDEPFYLNLNINSFCENRYKFYPKCNEKKLCFHYLNILKQISNLREQDPFNLKEENLLFTQGSAEGIDLLIRTYCEPKEDTITITTPSFPYYAYRASIENVIVLDAVLGGDNFDQLNIKKILSSSSKLLFLCSPNNPVGSLLIREQVETIIQMFDGLVIVDEAYLEWSDSQSYIDLLSKYENLVVLRTFSKIWGLAGIRSGVVIANKKILDPLKIMQTMFNFPEPVREILSENFTDVPKIFEYKAKAFQARKDLIEFLSNFDFVKQIFMSHANFLLVQFFDAEAVLKHLIEAKIFVKNCSDQVPNALRISLGTTEEMEHFKYSVLNFSKCQRL